ncbi:hypothetical protein CRI94_10895 [Longibacter salinarum]|uniref:histidine kinase n=1 Tax=Longibacter salinarum TaxID=1850348 RepID=A0A2A8CWX7_9BACT|nr:PAS domain S-box protein [Longibacter salinarum]PEN13146.1 hypothetical protein CRI94_10895 [Longibacter salinarum]
MDGRSWMDDIDWYSVVASMSDGVLVCASDGRILECSDGAAAMFGCVPEEAVGRPVHELVGPCLCPDGRAVSPDDPIGFSGESGSFIRGLMRPNRPLQWVEFDPHRPSTHNASTERAPAVVFVLTRTSFPFVSRDDDRIETSEEQVVGPNRSVERASQRTSEVGEPVDTVGDLGQTVGRYRSTSEHGVFAADAGMVSLFGYSAETLRTTDADQLLVNPSHAKTLREKRREKGLLHREEVHFRRRNGTSFWGLLTSLPAYGEDANVRFYDNIIVDITDLKETQFALEASEELYRVLAEHSVDIVTRHAMDSTYHYVSPSVESVLGYTPEELMGTRAIDITHPEDLGLYQQIGRALDEDARIKERVRFLHKDGHYVWLEVTGRLVRDPETDAGIEYVASSRDVTLQVESENVLRFAAQRLRILSDISQATLQTTDLETVCQVALDTLARAVSQTRSSILAFHEEKGYAEVLAVRSPGDEEIDEGTVLSLEWLHTYDDLRHGRDGWVSDLNTLSTSSPLLNRLEKMGIQSFISVPAIVENRTVGALNIAHDEPDAFTFDDVAIAREVGRLIALAMRQKQYQEDLVEAKEEAEEMSRLKSAFLANMSHEIRTPLTAILGFADVLATEAQSPHDELARLISRSGHRLMETLDSVLQLSRLEAGNLQLNPEPVNIIEEVREVITLMEPRAEEEEVDLHVEMPDHAVEGQLDAMAFFRVLGNLVNNAIKFTERGGSVNVSVRAENDMVVVVVQDTGIGMVPSAIPQLFGAFRQESTGTERSHEGSGLGLTIVRRLVDLMGGTIDVESTKGEGSTFTIQLPAGPVRRGGVALNS